MEPEPREPGAAAGPPGPGALPADAVRAALEQADVALLVLDPDGVVRHATGRELRVEPRDLVGRSVFDLELSPEQVAAVSRALRGEPVRFVTERDGRWWQASYTPREQDGELLEVVGVFADVTERVLAERASADRERYLQAVLDAAGEAIVVLDPDGRVLTVNARFAQLFPGWQAPGTRLQDVVRGDARQTLQHQLARRAEGHHDRYQLRVRDATGEVVWLQVAGSPLLRADGTVAGSVAVLTDITATKLEELRHMTAARTDPLTGAATRLTLDDRIEHALARRDAGVVAVLFCDVDGLKAVNDRSGHAAGDELLRQVCRRIAGALRPADTLARYGGDEFVVVCGELPSALEAQHLAERIRAAVSDGAGDTRRTVSVGVATSPPCTGPDELLAMADSAAYVAKRAGGDAVHVSE